MSSPILHGTALCPLLRFPRGGRTQIRVVMDEALDLAGDVDDILFAARARYGADRATLRYSRSGTAEAWTAAAPNTATLSLAPDAADETEGSERTLADLHDKGAAAWRMDFLAADGLPLARIQGDIEYLPEEGDWTDDPASETTLPSLTVSLVNGAVAVTVSLIGEGAAVDNAAVVTAIEEDPEAARTALELGTAALEDVGAFAPALGNDDNYVTDAEKAALHAAATVSGNGISITGQQISLSIGTGATQVAAGNHTHAYGDASGPASSTDNAIARFDGAGGKTVQNSGVTIDDAGNITTPSNGHFTAVDSGAFKLTGTGTTNHNSFSGVINWYGFAAITMNGVGIVVQVTGLGGGRNGLHAVNLETSGSVVTGSFTVATVPAASTHARGLIFVSNESGGAVIAFSDGTDWRRVTDRAIIS